MKKLWPLFFCLFMAAVVNAPPAWFAFHYIQPGESTQHPAAILGSMALGVTVPIGIFIIAFGIILSLKDNLMLLTLIRLIQATLFSLLVTLLFPLILFVLACYLKAKRHIKFSEVWKESPQIYHFFILNIYPIFFQILPGLTYVKRNGKMELVQQKKANDTTVYESSLNLAKMERGDIILTGQESWNHSIPIQASNILSNGEAHRYWSHVALYIGDGKVIEAQSDGRGVTETVIADYFFKKGHRLKVLRHRYMLPHEYDEVIAFCEEKRNMACPYDRWGVSFYALANLIPPMLSGWLEEEFAEKFFNVKDAYFCSELVADAFTAAGHNLFFRKSWRVKPLDFAFNPLFMEVDCDYQRMAVVPPGQTPPVMETVTAVVLNESGQVMDVEMEQPVDPQPESAPAPAHSPMPGAATQQV